MNENWVSMSWCVCRFNASASKWLLTSADDPNVSAVFNKSTEIPLGKQPWVFSGESCDDYAGAVDRVLQVSACSEREFTCDDGLCIQMENRCNRRADCQDNSDERNCQVVCR